MERRIVLSDDAKGIFDKYCTGFARRLKMDDALKMFQTDFKFSEPQSVQVFRMFDKDQNGFLSQWEFAQFYELVGQSAEEIMKMYQSVLLSGTDQVDIGQTWDLMKTVSTQSCRCVTDEELEVAMKQCAGADKSIDFMKFIQLWCRIKQIRT